MTDWFIGISLVFMFLAAVAEALLTLRSERKEREADAQNALPKIDAGNQPQLPDAETLVPRQQKMPSETVTAS